MEKEILRKMNCPFDPDTAVITQLFHEEDNEPYQVWKVETRGNTYILKEAQEYEAEVYPTLLQTSGRSVPKLYRIHKIEDKTYLLMEYIQGQDLRKCTRPALTLVLDALIEMQRPYWNSTSQAGYSFELSLPGRRKRREYLKDSELEMAYDSFLSLYSAVPRTLCHDDFLPFNVLVSDGRAVLIDWEYAGILPYPTSFARLIAHGEEDTDAFFYMTQSDRDFAIDYYYDHLLKEKGIAYDSWRRTLDYFLFYEYCEWVMIGNKYGTTDGAYYQKYLPLAKQQARKLIQI